MTRRLRTPLLVLVAGLTLAATACGGDDDSDAGNTPGDTSVAEADTTVGATETTAADAAPETTVSDRLYGDSGTATTVSSDASAATGAIEVVDSSLGEILASDGKTLYAFLPDGGKAPTCSGDCATAWPPLMAGDDVTFGDGVEADDFGTAARSDGGEQVTFYGWPLYFYSGDSAPGDVNGQGLGDSWYVVAPDGSMIEG
ncbi:MAG: hypothetical protein AB7Q42_07390 [Acidimicrobiia bacterium]